MNEGWDQSFDRLSKLVEQNEEDTAVVLERIFNSPLKKFGEQ